MKKPLLSIVVFGFAVSAASAITVVVDYSLDSGGFFDTQLKRDAMQAAADRYSRIIDSELAAVGPGGTGTGTSAGWRIGFSNPGTGASYQISTAGSFGSDPLAGAGAANQYGFGGLNANEWILFAGGRSMGSTAIGGTGTGANFTSTFNDIYGPMHRGFADNTPGNTVADLPRWGGAISFDTGTSWHFDLVTAASGGNVDFYSVALHEIGHALGLSTSWNQWLDDGSGGYVGPEALAAYNADNGTSLTTINLVSAGNNHWEDGTYDSKIFALGDPNLAGTVGLGAPQDLLMEPIADFSPSQRRIELTNTDVGALRDLGWSVVIPEPSVLVFGFVGLLVGMRRRR